MSRMPDTTRHGKTQDGREWRLRAIYVVGLSLSLVAYVACMPLAPFSIANANGAHQGYSSGFSILLTGWLGLMFGWLEWYANPLLWTTWLLLLLRKYVPAQVTSVSAVLLALSFVRRPEIPMGPSGPEAEILSLNAGYWLWVASMAMTLVIVQVAARAPWMPRRAGLGPMDTNTPPAP